MFFSAFSKNATLLCSKIYRMNDKQPFFRSIVSEQHSPLFRIMWVFGAHNPRKRHFDNNIIAFHIGGGYILSVAHNLRTECSLLRGIPEEVFRDQLLPLLSESQAAHFQRCYLPDDSGNYRYLEIQDQSLVGGLTETFRSSGFDNRWVSLGNKGVCKPHLIVQFKEDSFYGNPAIGDLIPEHSRFYEGAIQRHTYLLQLDLVEAFYDADIALYRLAPEVLDAKDYLPSVDLDFSILDDRNTDVFCLQSSPSGFLGRLLNKATIEGYLDQHQMFFDRIGGNYILEGFRYLIRGYFRFGSSGAPYLFYDESTGLFKANAIQSEASPVQLSINNSREGNFQYVNAIASPLMLVEKRIKELTGMFT